MKTRVGRRRKTIRSFQQSTPSPSPSQVYAASWAVVAALFLLLVLTSRIGKGLSAHYRFAFRLIKLLALFAVVLVLGLCLAFTPLSFSDVGASVLAFVPTGWGLLSVSAMNANSGAWADLSFHSSGYGV